ncbi:hypothetical protein J6590_089474 [Homalodisca vitripennis]|nr:hypothetical protein J6590_089474 [Homalodisca vitripennis]
MQALMKRSEVRSGDKKYRPQSVIHVKSTLPPTLIGHLDVSRVVYMKRYYQQPKLYKLCINSTLYSCVAGVGYAICLLDINMDMYYYTIFGWAVYYLFASFRSELPWTRCDNPWNTLNSTLYSCFTGVGYAICLLDIYMGMYYNTIIGWAVYYLFASFRSELPWTSCDNPWNTLDCTLYSCVAGVGYAICLLDIYMGMYYNTIIGWAVYYLFASFRSELPWTTCDNPWNTLDCTLYSCVAGVGYAICLLDIYMGMYYNTIIGWAVYYLFASFRSELPWTSCDNPWNTLNCTPVLALTDNDTSSVSPAKEFFE